MKPDNAITLPVDMDLSESSLESALDIISEKLPNNKKMKYGFLSVPSQILGQAVLIVKYCEYIKLQFPYINIYIDINSQYSADEWSITINNWNDDLTENNPITVWTSGA